MGLWSLTRHKKKETQMFCISVKRTAKYWPISHSLSSYSKLAVVAAGWLVWCCCGWPADGWLGPLAAVAPLQESATLARWPWPSCWWPDLIGAAMPPGMLPSCPSRRRRRQAAPRRRPPALHTASYPCNNQKSSFYFLKFIHYSFKLTKTLYHYHV